jgi:hypothetical protein
VVACDGLTERKVSESTGVPVRALDWRYLLPHPGPLEILTLLGGSPAMARLAMEHRVAKLVIHDSDAAASDAVIALDHSPVALDRLGAMVREGGVVYVELDRRRRAHGLHSSSVHAVSEALERVQIAVRAVYAIGPADGYPQTFIPIHATDALAWFVSHRFEASSFAAVLAERALRIAGYSRRMLATFGRRFAVVGVKSGATSPPAILSHPALQTLLGRAPSAPLVFAAGGDRVVALPFPESGGDPLAVVKVPRSPAFSGRTVNEVVQVTALRRMLDRGLRDALPEPITTIDVDGMPIAVERAMPGILLARACARRDATTDDRIRELDRAVEWIIAFHRATERERVAICTDGRVEAFDALERRFSESLGTTQEELALFESIRRYAGTLSSAVEIPIVTQHRDFTVWNIVRHGNRLAVLDWEGARDGIAGTDLVHLLLSWTMLVNRGSGPRAEAHAFEALFIDTGADHARLARTTVARYFAALSMDLRLLPLVLVSFALELAVRRHDQQRDSGESSASPRNGNHYVALVELLARERARLFALDAAASAIDR